MQWVIQFDPPSNAEAFVHRCGRTARSGQKGQAVVFLLPSEKAYVDFIALNQKVQLTEMPVSEDSTDKMNLLSILRDWQKNDRSIFDMANRAFVSHLQSYSKHECKYILRIKGKCFIKNFIIGNFTQHCGRFLITAIEFIHRGSCISIVIQLIFTPSLYIKTSALWQTFSPNSTKTS